MQFIDRPSALEQTAQVLAGAPRLYLDTEFESNRFGSRICLLQISAGDEIYLVDTLKLDSLEPLRSLFAQESSEWVLHAGLQDVQLLVEALGLRGPASLFDTQVAWGLLSAENAVSLAYLQYRVLGKRSSKAHQADDWTRRPLPASQLSYAADDVRHLPELRERLGERARELGREGIVVDASLELLRPVREVPGDLSLDSFRNAWQLEPAQQAALRFLIGWHNSLSPAERAQVPETKTLLAIAGRLPDSVDALARIKGVPRGLVQRSGQALVKGLQRAAAEARAEDFVPIDPAPYATFEEIRLDAWFTLARAEVCSEVQAAPELALPGRVLKQMRAALVAGKAPVAALSGWRQQLVGEAFERFCQRHPAPL